MIKSLKTKIKGEKKLLFLILCLTLFSILRIPSLIEPNWYGDEGIYQVIGAALNQGRGLYTQIWDNKPPGLYYIYALANGDLFTVKLLSLLAGALSIIPFFALANHLFKRPLSANIATLTYAILFAIPLLEGNIANAENFMLFPIVLAFYLVFTQDKKNTVIRFSISGILLSFAFITKIVAIFDVLAIIIAAAIINSKNKKSWTNGIKGIVKKSSILVISFAILPTLVTVYFALNNSITEYISGVIGENIGYVAVRNYVFFPMDILITKVVFAALTLLYIAFRKPKKSTTIIYVWLVLGVVNASFSGRPYTHYLLNALPPFALLIGNIADNIKKTKALTIAVGAALVVVFIAFSQFNIYKKNTAYYQNYIEYVFSGKSNSDYMTFFDQNTVRDYALARFLISKSAKNILVLSDSGQIYTLAQTLPPGRYIVAYHITFYPEAIDETKKVIQEKNPEYIILTKDDPKLKQFLIGYEIKYKVNEGVIYERI